MHKPAGCQNSTESSHLCLFIQAPLHVYWKEMRQTCDCDLSDKHGKGVSSIMSFNTGSSQLPSSQHCSTMLANDKNQDLSIVPPAQQRCELWSTFCIQLPQDFLRHTVLAFKWFSFLAFLVQTCTDMPGQLSHRHHPSTPFDLDQTT